MKLRDKRYIDFIEKHLSELEYFHSVQSHPGDAFKIVNEQQEVFIFYPKSDRILIPSKNRWYHNGLDFIKRNLIP